MKMDKEIFSSYRMTDDKEQELWKNAIFIFDSSALLEFYFVPKTTRIKIYEEVFKKTPSRLWIPFHVQYEYLKNREHIIKKPISEKYAPLKVKIKDLGKNATSKILKQIEAIERETKKDDKHPHVEQCEILSYKEIVNKFILDTKSFEDNILNKIGGTETEILDIENINNDDVLQSIEQYFQVGKELTFNEIIEITKEGKHRYEFKIPPGYGDLYGKEKKGTQIFGDLIIWKQILEYSKEKKSPVIFITNDIKKDNDWCYLDKNATEDRIESPREELIKEIKDFSGVDFWMYNLPQFLFNAKKYLKASIDEGLIQSISQHLNTQDQKAENLRFKCSNCGMVHVYQEGELDLHFECVGSSERNMGAENQYEADEYFECECGNNIEVKFSVWEYPIGVHNYDSIEIEGAELLNTFSFTIDFFEEEHDFDDRYLGSE